jgi:hypothetical protein
MTELLNLLKAIPNKVVAIVTGLLDGIAAMSKSPKKVIVLIIAVIAAADLILKGALGLISYSIIQAKAILAAIQAGGWPLVVLALILIIWKQNKTA